MKTKVKFRWKIVKIFCIIIKLLFNKTAGFIFNFLIFMLPVALYSKFTVTRENIGFIAFSLIIYPFFWELICRFCNLKKKIKEIHGLLDEVVYSIDNNLEDD